MKRSKADLLLENSELREANAVLTARLAAVNEALDRLERILVVDRQAPPYLTPAAGQTLGFERVSAAGLASATADESVATAEAVAVPIIQWFPDARARQE